MKLEKLFLKNLKMKGPLLVHFFRLGLGLGGEYIARNDVTMTSDRDFSYLEDEVRECTETTATIGPSDFKYSLDNIMRTAELVEEPTELELKYGEVPDWINLNWYRTGPGKFEFGDEAYLNMGDPMAMLQRIEIKNGNVKYQSQWQGSRHHQMNENAGKIVTAEVGTWGQPDWVETNDNLTVWLQHEDFVSDNTYVSFFAIGGRLFASGETYYIWEVDPITAKGVKRIDLTDLLPKTLFKNGETDCTTVATHLGK